MEATLSPDKRWTVSSPETTATIEHDNLFTAIGMMSIKLGLIKIETTGLKTPETEEQRADARDLQALATRFENANSDYELGRLYSELLYREGLWMCDYPEFNWRIDEQLQERDHAVDRQGHGTGDSAQVQ